LSDPAARHRKGIARFFGSRDNNRQILGIDFNCKLLLEIKSEMSATKHSFSLPNGAADSDFRFVKFDFQRKIHANVHSFSVMRTAIR
jgi:hypothetical protein